MYLEFYLRSHPAAWITFLGILGLIIGSFLNVVIHRLPIMLNRSWQRECRSLLDLQAETAESPAFNLVTPGSSCPHCAHAIRPWENIPVLSYVWLRGKCSNCGKHISPRYPAVELISAALAVSVANHFGYGAAAAAACALSWALVALAFIDIDHQLLPDAITMPVLWAGLIVNSFGIFTSLQSALIGAVAGYLSLWLVFHGFRLLTGKEGMGHGDFKLFALFGAWLGWQLLPLIILLASVVGAVVGIGLIVLRGRDHQLPIPFGPFLCVAGWIALSWGQVITNFYLQLAHFAS